MWHGKVQEWVPLLRMFALMRVCPTPLEVVKLEFTDFFHRCIFVCVKEILKKIFLQDKVYLPTVYGFKPMVDWAHYCGVCVSQHSRLKCVAKQSFYSLDQKISPSFTHYKLGWQPLAIKGSGESFKRSFLMEKVLLLECVLEGDIGTRSFLSFTPQHSWCEPPPLPHSPALEPKVVKLEDPGHKTLKSSSTINPSSL